MAQSSGGEPCNNYEGSGDASHCVSAVSLMEIPTHRYLLHAKVL